MEVLSRVCRVLPVGMGLNSDLDRNIYDWLKVLLPLDLPQPSTTWADSLAELARRSSDITSRPIAKELIAAAALGPKSVEAHLRRLILEALNRPEDNNGP
jgi:hypothetical protein